MSVAPSVLRESKIITLDFKYYNSAPCCKLPAPAQCLFVCLQNQCLEQYRSLKSFKAFQNLLTTCSGLKWPTSGVQNCVSRKLLSLLLLLLSPLSSAYHSCVHVWVVTCTCSAGVCMTSNDLPWIYIKCWLSFMEHPI